jgi:translation initiation factor IF-2
LTKTNYRINIIDYSVGPLSEADINSAAQTGAVIFGFDVPINPNVAKMADPSKVPVRVHKLIYKFVEDI